MKNVKASFTPVVPPQKMFYKLSFNGLQMTVIMPSDAMIQNLIQYKNKDLCPIHEKIPRFQQNGQTFDGIFISSPYSQKNKGELGNKPIQVLWLQRKTGNHRT